ncbi:MAG: hypothetical protein VX938_10435, partial [Myxococcota bacterium]|nr:hypothetical protein [Myxococcota bacterium]
MITRYLSRQEAPASAALQVFAAHKLRGDISGALTWLARADQLEPRADHDRTRGELLLAQEDLEGARAAFLSYINREALGLVGTAGRRRRHQIQAMKGVSSRAERASSMVVRSYERRGLYGEARGVISSVEKSLGRGPWNCITQVRLAVLAGDLQGGLRRLREDLTLAIKAPRDDVILLLDALEGRQRSTEAAWFLRRILNQRWDTDLGLMRLQQLIVVGRRVEAHAQGVEIALRGGASGRIRAAELALQGGAVELAAELIDVPGLPLGDDEGLVVDRVRTQVRRRGLQLKQPRRPLELDPRVEGLLAEEAPGQGARSLLKALERNRGMGGIAHRALVEVAALEEAGLLSEATELIGRWGQRLRAGERLHQMALWLEASHRPCAASRLLEEGLELNRADPQVVLALMSAARRCGDETQTDRALAWATELWSGEPMTLLQLGRRLLEQGDTERAREMLKRVPQRGGLPGMERALQESWLAILSDAPVSEVTALLQDVIDVAPALQSGREAVWELLLDLERPELAFDLGGIGEDGSALTSSGRSLVARLAWGTGRDEMARTVSRAGTISGSEDGMADGLKLLRAAALANDAEGTGRLVHEIT